MGSERRRELEETLEDMRSELADSREELAHARREIGELTDQLLAQQAPGDETETAEDDPGHVERLAARIATLESRLMATDEGSDPGYDPTLLPSQLDAVRQQLADAQQREAHLLAGALRAERIVTDAGLRLAELGETADRAELLESELDETARRYEAGRDALQQAHARVDLLETDAAQAALAHQRATTELAEALSSIADLTERNEAAELREAGSAQQIEAAEREVHATKDRISGLNDALAVAQLERDGARSELVRQMQEIEDFAARNTELAAELEEHQRSIDMTETARIAADERARVAHDRVVALEDEVAGANAERDEAVAATGVAEGVLDELRAELASSRAVAQELEATAVATAEHVAEVEGRSLQLEADHETAQHELGSLQIQLAAAVEETVVVRSEIDPIRSDAEAAHQEAARAQERMEALAVELDALRAERELERQTLDAASAERELAQQTLDAANAELELARATIAANALEQEALRSDVEAARAEVEAIGHGAAVAGEQTAAAVAAAADAQERLIVAEERALGAERLLVDFQNRLQEAEAREAEAREAGAREAEAAAVPIEPSVTDDTVVVELREQLEAASQREQEERTRAESLLAELDEAHERLRTAEALDSGASTEGSAPVSDDQDTAREFAELEERLEQAEARARRAYAAAESAEAALRFKEGGGGSADPHLQEENVKLRTQVAELTDRLGQLQRQP